MGAHTHLALALILIALGTGYWVLVQAAKQDDGTLKRVGTILGYFITVVALLVSLMTIYHAIRPHGDGHGGKRGGHGMMMGYDKMCHMKGNMRGARMHADSLKGMKMHGDRSEEGSSAKE